jgi:hypothetical protein
MKYWYLKNGDVLGPLSAEEIVKDESFAEDSLVCPEDKAEQAEFWKTSENYAQDFSPALEAKKAASQNIQNTASEEEMEIPQEVFLDDIEPNENALKKPEQIKEITPKEEKPLPKEEVKKETPAEEKNPFENNNPQISPNIEDTLSSHAAAPRLDAEGDTLLEDIPAKAILAEEEPQEVDFPSAPSYEENEPLDDAPILNIFERPINAERNKTKEITDISADIYDKYGSDDKQKPVAALKDNPYDAIVPEEINKKSKKIILLFILMFVLVIVALLLALFSPNEQNSKTDNTDKTEIAYSEEKVKSNPLEIQESPTTDVASYFNSKTDNSEKEIALTKVKKYVLSSGKTVEEYLNQQYGSYQTSWKADILSGKNYYVNFNASKIRQEPIVYSFTIDLDKNTISGLNNLGMDLLVKGE